MKEIPLTCGGVAIVDDDDYYMVSKIRWRRHDRGGQSYASSGRAHHVVHMHRMIAKTPEGFCTDHINGDGLDNRKANLRVCSMSQNIMNSRKIKIGSSRFKGVSLRKDTGRYRAYIFVDGRIRHLGHFQNEEDAARAYDVAAKTEFKDFAKTNFPEKE